MTRLSIRCWLLPACLALSAVFALAQKPLPQLAEAGVAHLKRSLPAQATAKPAQPRRLLIYNFTHGTYHDEAIAWATRALELMGEKTGAFSTTTSVDAAVFTPERLREFDAMVMNNTMLAPGMRLRFLRSFDRSTSAGRRDNPIIGDGALAGNHFVNFLGTRHRGPHARRLPLK